MKKQLFWSSLVTGVVIAIFYIAITLFGNKMDHYIISGMIFVCLIVATIVSDVLFPIEATTNLSMADISVALLTIILFIRIFRKEVAVALSFVSIILVAATAIIIAKQNKYNSLFLLAGGIAILAMSFL